jgi:hypothetical protein
LAEWVERMTENYLDAFGGKYEAELDCLKIQWPGETQMTRYALPTRTGTPPPKTELLRLDHPKVRGILSRLPRFVPGMPIPSLRLPSLPAGITGLWSLWEIWHRHPGPPTAPDAAVVRSCRWTNACAHSPVFMGAALP